MTFKVSTCATPLHDVFTFCRGPDDIFVMHDFAALAQVHSMTLTTLHNTATALWDLPVDLAARAAVAKELAYFVLDSSLPARYTLSDDLHQLHARTRTAADSLHKLGAATTGTMTR